MIRSAGDFEKWARQMTENDLPLDVVKEAEDHLSLLPTPPVGQFRASVALHDGAVTGDIAGYTLLADDALVAMRMNEMGDTYSLKAGIDSRTGKRLAQYHYVPVTAIRSLALITKNLR